MACDGPSRRVEAPGRTAQGLSLIHIWPEAPLTMLSRRAGFEARVVTLDEKGCERALFTRRWSSLLAPKVDASASETELPCEDG